MEEENLINQNNAENLGLGFPSLTLPDSCLPRDENLVYPLPDYFYNNKDSSTNTQKNIFDAEDDGFVSGSSEEPSGNVLSGLDLSGNEDYSTILSDFQKHLGTFPISDDEILPDDSLNFDILTNKDSIRSLETGSSRSSVSTMTRGMDTAFDPSVFTSEQSMTLPFGDVIGEMDDMALDVSSNTFLVDDTEVHNEDSTTRYSPCLRRLLLQDTSPSAGKKLDLDSLSPKPPPPAINRNAGRKRVAPLSVATNGLMAAKRPSVDQTTQTPASATAAAAVSKGQFISLPKDVSDRLRRSTTVNISPSPRNRTVRMQDAATVFGRTKLQLILGSNVIGQVSNGMVAEHPETVSMDHDYCSLRGVEQSLKRPKSPVYAPPQDASNLRTYSRVHCSTGTSTDNELPVVAESVEVCSTQAPTEASLTTTSKNEVATSKNERTSTLKNERTSGSSKNERTSRNSGSDRAGTSKDVTSESSGTSKNTERNNASKNTGTSSDESKNINPTICGDSRSPLAANGGQSKRSRCCSEEKSCAGDDVERTEEKSSEGEKKEGDNEESYSRLPSYMTVLSSMKQEDVKQETIPDCCDRLPSYITELGAKNAKNEVKREDCSDHDRTSLPFKEEIASDPSSPASVASGSGRKKKLNLKEYLDRCKRRKSSSTCDTPSTMIETPTTPVDASECGLSSHTSGIGSISPPQEDCQDGKESPEICVIAEKRPAKKRELPRRYRLSNHSDKKRRRSSSSVSSCSDYSSSSDDSCSSSSSSIPTLPRSHRAHRSYRSSRREYKSRSRARSRRSRRSRTKSRSRSRSRSTGSTSSAGNRSYSGRWGRSRSPRRSSHRRYSGPSPRYHRGSVLNGACLSSPRRTQDVEERRVIYVGNIPDGTTRDEIRHRFSVFGQVNDVSVHFRDHGENYGFVTFAYRVDAYQAIEHGNDDPSLPRFDLCFGGRRAFCKTQYADLDAARNPFPRCNDQNLDFDDLLRVHMAQKRQV